MLIESVFLSIVFTRTPERREAGDHLFQLDSSITNSLFLSVSGSPTTEYSRDLESALAEDFSKVPDVRHLIVEHAEGNLLVWIALDNPTREMRERVFQKELSLIEGFPEIDFDFNIVPSLNRDPPRIH